MKLLQKVLATMKQDVIPQIVSNAKDTGKQAAKNVFDERRGHIMTISLIPYYGWGKGITLIKDALRDAKSEARTAAENNVTQAFESLQTQVTQSPGAHRHDICTTLRG